MAAEARHYTLGADDGPVEDLAMGMLVNGHGYDIRRVAAGPGWRHGPGQYGGDACVLVLAGDVHFTVDDTVHPLAVHDLLWVPAGARRGFVAGEHGAILLAIHLPLAAAAESRGA